MDIETTSLYREVQAIWSSGVKDVHYTWTATLHPKKLNLNVPALKVVEVSVDSDFENNFGDGIIVSLILSGGTYANSIYPFKDDLEITLTKTPTGEVGGAGGIGQPKTERYRATAIDVGSPGIESRRTAPMTHEEMNLTNMLQVKFQLYNRAFEQLRLVDIGGGFRNARVDEVVKTVLTAESSKLKLDASWKFQGVSMVEGTNPNVYEQIPIPHGINVLNLPAYINKNVGGLYSAGLGYYLQGAFWYLYPCYDTTRFKKARRTISILLMPEDKMGESDRTFMVRGSNVSIIAAGNIKYRDPTDSQQRQLGNGVRFADANQMVSGFAQVADNKAVASRADNNSEFVAIKRNDGLNYAPVSDRRITANPFYEYSELAKRSGKQIALTWNHSDPSLLSPDTMVRIYYLNQGRVQQLEGVLQRAVTFHQLRGHGITESVYVARTVLSVFVRDAG